MPDDVDHLAFRKLGDRQNVARFVVCGIIYAELDKFRYGSYARFFQVPEFRLGHALFFLRTEADLHGVITVALSSFYLRDGARASLNDRDGNKAVVLVENLGHAQFFSD